MVIINRIVILCFSAVFCFQAHGQESDIDSELSKLTPFIQALQKFSSYIPQEKVYLHFDNTSYYQDDHIWFKCYVTSAQHQLSELSKTLYVELLNPGGEIIDKRILKIENGQCHGDFMLSHIPFYSGFYEVRAYTKYMLNFGDDVIFSRLLPVFDNPKEEGSYEEKNMMNYGRWGTGNYPMKRERPIRENRVNLRFFPEGGNLVQGVASRVAFEATDEVGNPIDVTGVVLDENRQEISSFATLHEGRGVFTYTPNANTGRRRDIVEVEYSGRKYSFDLPTGLSQGVVMEVDNLSHPDSIGITIRKNEDIPSQLLGVTVLNGGEMQVYYIVRITRDEVNFKIDKTQLSSGVSQIVLFNSNGEILCDRLVFTDRRDEILDIKARTTKQFYGPFELVNMEISVTDGEANPEPVTFSISIRDGENEVESNHNILTDLLLMSEIKGYVRNPSYYFEDNEDEMRNAALDLLLMVQGWRRYSWKQMAGMEPLDLKYLPEQGIETNGNVITWNLLGKEVSKSQVDIDLVILRKTENDSTGISFAETFVTDDNGRFSFVSDVEGRWNMILSAKENGRGRNYQILLDRVFSPELRRYRYSDLQVNIAEKAIAQINDNDDDDETLYEDIEADWMSFLAAYNDSIAKLGFENRVQQLGEVTVTARRTRAQEILENRSTSISYYDVASEYDDIYDKGIYVGDDIHELLINMNPDFSTKYIRNDECLFYKGRMVFFVVNYQPTRFDEMGYFNYKNFNINAIKSIYINENISVMVQYIESPDPILLSPLEIVMTTLHVGLSCAVFIETYPEDEIPAQAAKGVRKTWLEGYSAVSEFYNPNYLGLLPGLPDYRRTLYWNPSVTTDETGHAKIEFYNNSRSRYFSISAETVTPNGMIGVYKER